MRRKRQNCKGEIGIDLKKREGESQASYHKRLVYGKLVDKTLADIDYTELAELLYGKRYANDVARRMMYGSRYTLDLIGENKSETGDKSTASELDAKIEELKKERQKYFDQRREYNKIVAEAARSENLAECLIKAADSLRETVGNVYGEEQPTDNYNYYSDFSKNEAVLVFSDWHYGMTTRNAFNFYNIDVCRERVARVAHAAAERLQLHRCKTLHIVVLGDLFHGAIHTSARVASEELACDQLMQSSELLAQTVEYLSEFVSETIVYVTYGNHARTVQVKADNIHRDNMERIVPWWLEQRLKGNNSIIIAQDAGTEFLFVEAAGHEFCATHGDNDSVKDAAKILPTLFRKQFGKDIEYILLGDKHHRESFNELGITSLLCGSLCGTDDYANEKRLYSDPSQILLIVNKECGVDAEYRIKC